MWSHFKCLTLWEMSGRLLLACQQVGGAHSTLAVAAQHVFAKSLKCCAAVVSKILSWDPNSFLQVMVKIEFMMMTFLRLSSPLLYFCTTHVSHQTILLQIAGSAG